MHNTSRSGHVHCTLGTFSCSPSSSIPECYAAQDLSRLPEYIPNNGDSPKAQEQKHTKGLQVVQRSPRAHLFETGQPGGHPRATVDSRNEVYWSPRPSLVSYACLLSGGSTPFFLLHLPFSCHTFQLHSSIRSLSFSSSWLPTVGITIDESERT